MSPVTHPAPLTTHDETKGLTSLRLSRAQRMGWARSILADLEIHSDARIRRACLTILNHAGSDDHADRQVATDLLRVMQVKLKGLMT